MRAWSGGAASQISSTRNPRSLHTYSTGSNLRPSCPRSLSATSGSTTSFPPSLLCPIPRPCRKRIPRSKRRTETTRRSSGRSPHGWKQLLPPTARTRAARAMRRRGTRQQVEMRLNLRLASIRQARLRLASIRQRQWRAREKNTKLRRLRTRTTRRRRSRKSCKILRPWSQHSVPKIASRWMTLLRTRRAWRRKEKKRSHPCQCWTRMSQLRML
mmetsp:Transcript_11441/g.26134  ORF Transcript_11441/g.26134 Transcript_11441/m.26134 type:complete len:214 (+) Transcript_11441:1697-2338(+)